MNTLNKLIKGAFAFIFLITSSTIIHADTIVFSGGPDGGTFKYFAKGISDYVNEKQDKLKLIDEPSAGSVDNLQKVNNRLVDLGITYSGDLYLGRNGKLAKRSRQYRNVHALAYLYGAPAHLVVLESSGINSVADLSFGRNVAVGRVGSGAATAAKRFFESMRLWRKINPKYIGYKEGSEALKDGSVDALWVFAGFPNTAVKSVADENSIRLLPVYEDAKNYGVLFKEYPFYKKVVIPAGTYKGVNKDVISFQDSALLTAGHHIRSTIIEEILGLIYKPEGLEFLVSRKSTAKAMSIESGITGIVTPLHQGAEKFWKEKGKTLTDDQMHHGMY